MNDSDWRYWFKSYFQDENPWAESDESKREWIEFAWEVAACVGMLAFFVWLSFLPHGA